VLRRKKSVKPLRRYRDFVIFPHGGRRHLGFVGITNDNHLVSIVVTNLVKIEAVVLTIRNLQYFAVWLQETYSL